ncbi:MAG: hypothetical protein ACTTJH_00635 [Bacteroidales bacterium]
MKTIIKTGESLQDLALRLACGMEGVYEIAKANGLEIDFVANNLTEVDVPFESNQNITQMMNNADFVTGIIIEESDETQEYWVLKDGYWDDEGIWIDEEYWKD